MLTPNHKAAMGSRNFPGLKNVMQMIWRRIEERFSTSSPAFRLFDRTANGKVTIDSFMLGLEALNVKLSSKDVLRVFKHLDTGRKSYITYGDFCNLSDERRSEADPAIAMLEEYKGRDGEFNE